jgi:hypothetical protein
MQAMHGRLSDPGHYQALQHFITHSPWDAARVWAHLRTVVPIRTGILAIGDTGFPKQGTRSVAAQRQYCGALGKVGPLTGARGPWRTTSTCPRLGLRMWYGGRRRASRRRSSFARSGASRWRRCARSCRRVSRSPAWWWMPTTGAMRASAGLERLGFSYGVAIRGEAVCAVVGVRGPQSVTAIAQSAPEDAWESLTWGTAPLGR